MRKFLAIAAAATLASFSTLAIADEAPAAAAAFVPHQGQMVFSSDGKRIGRIDRVAGDRVGIIADMKYVFVPVATLSASEKSRVVTTLTAAEVRK